MEQPGQNFESNKFSSPEEELKYLRERVAVVEGEHRKEGRSVSREAVISQEVIKYASEPAEQHLEEHFILESPQFEQSVEILNSVEHRERMRELYKVLAEKGILNAIRVARELNSPHLEDDFHSVLVRYVKSGAIIPGLDKERELARNLNKTLYEVTLPHAEGDKVPTVAQAMESMQRFFAGMLPSDREHAGGHGGMTIELAMPSYSSDIIYYIAVKDEYRQQFMQQLFGTFPGAKIEEVPRDYNIFNNHGVSLGSVAVNLRNFAFPIADLSQVDNDPMKVLLSSFSKIARDGEGAAVQFVVLPETTNISGKIKFAIGKIHEGVPIKDALDIPLSVAGDLMKSVAGFFRSPPKKKQGEEPKVDNRTLEFKNKALEMLEEKLTAQLTRVNLRIVASAGTKERANEILSSIESAFNQFTSAQGNGIRFVRKEKGELTQLLENFMFRRHDDDDLLILNLKEISSLYHFPVTISRTEAPQLKTVKAASASAPADLPNDGVVLGVNKYRGVTREVRLERANRLRHLYVIGQTGTGKTKLLKNMIIQDIKNGDGVCFIDPHGSDIEAILANIPKERIEDVIYFDPSYTPRPFALNMLEYDPDHPEQKIFVVNEMLSIFRKLYAAGNPESMGPAFEQYFRNSTMLVMEDPETGNTLLEIPRVMADPAFRNLKLSRCKNPLVVQFWRDIATKTTGEAGLQNMIPYITNKFDVFLSNDVMRPIIAQEKSSFNFRDIMDNRKILLVNLAKGKLGEINSHLIGLVLVGKILMAAMSRVDSIGKKLPDFYLYIDEFQNVTTDSISAILSEARKYGLSLNIAHQFIAQLDEGIKNAVFGNVGNMIVHRVGSDDAQFLEPQFAPVFTASDIIKLDAHNAYAKLLFGDGRPVPPFNIETLFHPKGNPEIVEQLKQLSYLKFGKDRKLVDDAVLAKYLAKPAPLAAQSASPAAGQLTQQWAPQQTPSVARPPAPPPLAYQQQAIPQQQIATQQQVFQQRPPQQVTPTAEIRQQVVMTPPPVPQGFPTPAVQTYTPPPPAPQPFAQAFARASIPQQQVQVSDPIAETIHPVPFATPPASPNVTPIPPAPAMMPTPIPMIPQAVAMQPQQFSLPPTPPVGVVTPSAEPAPTLGRADVRDPFETLNTLQSMSQQSIPQAPQKPLVPPRPAGAPDPYREPIA